VAYLPCRLAWTHHGNVLPVLISAALGRASRQFLATVVDDPIVVVRRDLAIGMFLRARLISQGETFSGEPRARPQSAGSKMALVARTLSLGSTSPEASTPPTTKSRPSARTVAV